jgi:hypothetical protein
MTKIGGELSTLHSQPNPYRAVTRPLENAADLHIRVAGAGVRDLADDNQIGPRDQTIQGNIYFVCCGAVDQRGTYKPSGRKEEHRGGGRRRPGQEKENPTPLAKAQPPEDARVEVRQSAGIRLSLSEEKISE